MRQALCRVRATAEQRVGLSRSCKRGGAVRGIDPQTGQYFDDTKRYVIALAIPEADKRKVFEGNARRVYPRLDSQLRALEK
jgi:hypothetical protein